MSCREITMQDISEVLRRPAHHRRGKAATMSARAGLSAVLKAKLAASTRRGHLVAGFRPGPAGARLGFYPERRGTGWVRRASDTPTDHPSRSLSSY